MQPNKNKTPQRHKDISTEMSQRSLRKEQLRFRSVETQFEKKKFAHEYAKITKEFRNILFKRNVDQKVVDVGSSRYKRVMTEAREFFDTSSSKNRDEFKSERKMEENNYKLETLYGNKLHQDILQTASKIVKRQKEAQKSHQTTKIGNFGNLKQEEVLDKEIFVHLQKEKQEKINSGFQYIEEILAHFHNLYKIRDLIEDYKNNYENMIKCVRRYIMNYNKADINKLDNMLKIENEREKLRVFLCAEKISIIGILDSMVRESEIAVRTEGKTALDAILGVYKSIFSYILSEGIYKNSEDRNVSIRNRESILACLNLMEANGIGKKKDLISTTEFLFKKIQNLFKYNLILLHKIKEVFTEITKVPVVFNASRITRNPSYLSCSHTENESEASIKHVSTSNKTNINRFFYYLLCEYARNFNSAENLEVLKIHKNMLDFFVTCPSPHLIYVRPQKTTVLIQFEGPLALMKITHNTTQCPPNKSQSKVNVNALNPNPNPNQYSPQSIPNKEVTIRLRPFSYELIEHLSKICEVVLITTLMPENILISHENGERESPELFKLCSCILFRYHYVRYRELLVKDISRLGRDLSSVILVDSIEKKMKERECEGGKEKINNSEFGLLSTHLYTENLLAVSTWKGNQKDEELIYLKEILNEIINEDEDDVRTSLRKHKMKLEEEKELNEEEEEQRDKEEGLSLIQTKSEIEEVNEEESKSDTRKLNYQTYENVLISDFQSSNL